jgi:arsenite methyltransferase
MAQLRFDDATAKTIQGIYQKRDMLRRRRHVREALAAAPGERILDVGCGPGFYVLELLEEVGPQGSIVGVDSSPDMLAAARHRCDGHANVAFHEGNAAALPVEDAGFDAALCVQVMEYVPEPAAALAEIHRALRPGGRAVIWDIDWATVWWHSCDPERMQRVLRAWDEHLVHPSLPRTLAAQMCTAGFEDVRLQAHSFATIEFDPEAFGVAMLGLIGEFVRGRGGVTEEEAEAWAAEQAALGERGEFFFEGTQFCFTGRKAG